MKKLILSTLATTCVVLSCNAFADRIIISGEPIAIEKRGDVYYVPENYQPTTDYYYVTVEGTKKVCYKNPQPNLALKASPLNVEIAGTRATWDCYAYDTNYFQ